MLDDIWMFRALTFTSVSFFSMDTVSRALEESAQGTMDTRKSDFCSSLSIIRIFGLVFVNARGVPQYGLNLKYISKGPPSLLNSTGPEVSWHP